LFFNGCNFYKGFGGKQFNLSLMGSEAETSLIPTVLCFIDLFVFGTLKGKKVRRNADEDSPFYSDRRLCCPGNNNGWSLFCPWVGELKIFAWRAFDVVANRSAPRGRSIAAFSPLRRGIRNFRRGEPEKEEKPTRGTREGARLITAKEN
jgi:hypothetical protein